MKPKHAKKKVKPWVPETVKAFGHEDDGTLCLSARPSRNIVEDLPIRLIREKDYQRLLKLASQSGKR